MAGMVKGGSDAMDKKYQTEDDARTMMRAVEISKDKPRYTACLKEMKKQMANMSGATSMMEGLKK